MATSAGGYTRVPYGYKRDVSNHGKYIPDGESAEIVKRIFVLAADGFTFNSIADTLNHENIAPPGRLRLSNSLDNKAVETDGTPRKWSALIVKRIIENPLYLGHTPRPILDREKEKCGFDGLDKLVRRWNTHEPLVDEALFQTANVMHGMRRNGFGGTGTIFDGKLFCATCGAPIFEQGETIDENGYKHPLLLCRYARSHDKKAKCIDAGIIPLVMLEEIVKRDLNGVIEELTSSEATKEVSSLTPKDQSRKKLIDIDKRIDLINRVSRRVYEDMEKNLLHAETGQEIIRVYNTELIDLLNAKAELQESTDDKTQIEINGQTVRERLGTIESLDRDIVDAFIKRIEIGHGWQDMKSGGDTTFCTQGIDITYNFSIEPAV